MMEVTHRDEDAPDMDLPAMRRLFPKQARQEKDRRSKSRHHKTRPSTPHPHPSPERTRKHRSIGTLQPLAT